MRRWRVLVSIAAASASVAPAGCGDDPPVSAPAEPSLERSAADLRELVDAAVAAVVPDLPSVPTDGSGQHGCGSETEDVAVTYGFSIRMPAEDIPEVIDGVRGFWSGRGAEDERPGDGLTFAFDGFIVGLTTFPGEGRITIGGSTDCYPPAVA